jgi:hypothetical protein
MDAQINFLIYLLLCFCICVHVQPKNYQTTEVGLNTLNSEVFLFFFFPPRFCVLFFYSRTNYVPMSALHTIVDPALPQQTPPQFFIKPPSTHDGFTSFTKPPPGVHIHHATGEEDIDDDEDEDDLEEDEEDDLDDSYPSFHLTSNNTKVTSVSQPNTSNTSYPSNNYLSINHIISPNTSQLPSQPQTAHNNIETLQASNPGISTNESTQNTTTIPSEQGMFLFYLVFLLFLGS